jgi:hypothetical protein
MKHIDEIYKDWCGESHLTNSCHPVHDSAEACDFAEYYHNEMQKKEPETRSFLITYRYNNITDASLHEEIVNDKSPVDVIYQLAEKHQYNIEWSTIKALPF